MLKKKTRKCLRFFKRPRRTTYFLNCKCPCFRSAGPCSPRRTCVKTKRETRWAKKKKKKQNKNAIDFVFLLFWIGGQGDDTLENQIKTDNLLADEFSDGLVVFAGSTVETERVDRARQCDQRPKWWRSFILVGHLKKFKKKNVID